jgi:DNA-binding transcriptional regulator YhcF (GntR family)
MTFSKKMIACCAAVVLAVTVLTGCASSQTAPVALVPQTANMIAEIQIGAIVNDPALITAYNNSSHSANQPQTVQDALDKLTEKTGLNIQDFSQLFIFGDTSSINTSNMKNADSGYMAIIAQGTFNEKTFVANIETKTGKKLDVSTYKTSQVYSNASENFSMVFFGSSMLVVGNDQAVKDCIDVHKGDKQPLSGIIVDTYNKLGEASIKAAFAIPAKAQNALAGELPSASALSSKAFSKMDTAGMAFTKGTQDVSINADLHFQDATSAQDAKDTINGMVSMIKGMAATSEIKTLLGQMQITNTDVWLNISLKTTLTDLQSLSKSLPSSSSSTSTTTTIVMPTKVK